MIKSVLYAVLFTFIASLLIFPTTSFGQHSGVVDVYFVNNNAEGECTFLMGATQPWIAINSSCRLDEMDGTTIKRQGTPLVISGYSLGDPVRSKTAWTWNRFLIGADPGEEYCAGFGIYDEAYPSCEPEDYRVYTLGHQDPNENPGNFCGAYYCESVPTQPPSDLTLGWAFGYCHTCDCTEWEVSHSATNASSYAVEHGLTSNGPWTVYSTTSAAISYPHNGSNGRWFRIKASNAAGYIYSSPIWKTGGWCYCGGEEP
ncbi:MAG: hypothetical protein IIA10_01025 [Proteobacteria bacterium]|nr:hypothetical protein [Pseudomonadota bacterium]